MPGHRVRHDLYESMANATLPIGSNYIKDPGNGLTIDPDGRQYTVCLLTIAASTAETRLLKSATNLPVGLEVLIVANTVGTNGTCTISGFQFTAAGDQTTFTVTESGNTKSWMPSRQGIGTLLFPLNMEGWKIWDDMKTNLGSTAISADDLIFTVGTYGTSAPTIKGSDVGGTSATQYARRQVPVPANYVPAGSLSLIVKAGMAVVADSSALLVAKMYRAAAPTVDLVVDSPYDINSVTLANITASISTTNIVPGDTLDIRIGTAVTDAGDAAPNINSIISEVHLACQCYL